MILFFLRGQLLALLGISLIGFSISLFAATQKQSQPALFTEQMATLEASTGGRLGVYAINTENNTYLAYRPYERFPSGCTSKVMGVGAILKKSMRNKTLLSKKVRYTKKDLISWSPITEQHVKDGMTVAELSAAAISYSDNTAMNLLVEQLGGLSAMNAFARSLHDHSFRQDHDWPAEAYSGGLGDVKDSTTPLAMAKSLKRLTLTKALDKPQQELLLSWLKTNTTGDRRIRAGVPKGWIVGDKTGTGGYYGTTNDIGIIWPPQCKPIVVAIYYTSDNKASVSREDVVAEATRLLIIEMARTDERIRRRL